MRLGDRRALGHALGFDVAEIGVDLVRQLAQSAGPIATPVSCGASWMMTGMSTAVRDPQRSSRASARVRLDELWRQHHQRVRADMLAPAAPGRCATSVPAPSAETTTGTRPAFRGTTVAATSRLVRSR